MKSGEACLTDFNGESDHVHLIIDFPPDVEISKLVNNLKTVSSRLIRRLIRVGNQPSIPKASVLDWGLFCRQLRRRYC
nr:transposase [Microseira wollei]